MDTNIPVISSTNVISVTFNNQAIFQDFPGLKIRRKDETLWTFHEYSLYTAVIASAQCHLSGLTCGLMHLCCTVWADRQNLYTC